MTTEIEKVNKDITQIENQNPSTFLEMAIKQGLSIEHLEKLMTLHEHWFTNQAKMSFLAAVTNFQYECPALEKTRKVDFTSKTGSHIRYNYAPLGEITKTLKESLKNNGLSFRWEMQDNTDSIVCTCIISHIGGHSEKTTMSALKDNSGGKNEIQMRGSTITYLQRYTLIAAFGISTADEDIDGRNDQQFDNTAGKKVIPKYDKKVELLPNPNGLDVYLEQIELLTSPKSFNDFLDDLNKSDIKVDKPKLAKEIWQAIKDRANLYGFDFNKETKQFTKIL